MRRGRERVCVFIVCSSVKNNWIFEIGEVGSQREARGRQGGGGEKWRRSLQRNYTVDRSSCLNMSMSKSYTVSYLTVLLPLQGNSVRNLTGRYGPL